MVVWWCGGATDMRGGGTRIFEVRIDHKEHTREQKERSRIRRVERSRERCARSWTRRDRVEEADTRKWMD